MEGIVKWLGGIEQAAADFYRAAAVHFAADGDFAAFLETLAEEELWHGHMLRTMAPVLTDGGMLSVVQLDEATRGNISGLFSRAQVRLHSGDMSRTEMLETIAAAEFSEWNEIFLYVLQVIKGRGDLYEVAVLEVERHKNEILEFLSNEPGGERFVETLRLLPSVAGKRILVIERHHALAMLLRSVLSPIGEVRIAESGPEGLALVEKGGYDVILSDINMPAMESLEFYDRVVGMAPEMKNRFVFFSSAEREVAYGPLAARDATLLVKPAMLSQIRNTVSGIANGMRRYH